MQRSDVGEFRRRYRWMVLFVMGVFLVLFGRLFILQVFQRDIHQAQARKNIVREIKLATRRGVIRDSQGKVLAASRPSYNVYVVPGTISLEQTWPRVVQLMGLDPLEANRLRARIVELSHDERRKKAANVTRG